MQIKANDIHMNYELSGKIDGSVVMMSHSLGSSLTMWDPQVPHLEHYFRVLRYDTRGHGGSDAPQGPYTLEMLGEDAVGLMDALGVKIVHFVGLSMGGMIGQYLGLHHPERLRSLVLCDTAAGLPSESQSLWKERIALAREKGLEALVQSTLERWFTPGYLKEDPPIVRVIRKLFLLTPVEGFIGCIEAISRLNYLEALPAITTPTLLMVGENDMGTPVEASKAMHERIRTSQMLILPSAAHLSNIEQADAFNQALLTFLLRN